MAGIRYVGPYSQKLVKDYDCKILYHLGKANKVVDALSQKSSATLMSIQALPRMLQEDIQRLALEIFTGQMSTLTLQPNIFEEIKKAQELDPTLKKLKEDVIEGRNI